MRSCLNQTQNLIFPQCAVQSVGTANHLFTTLIQTLITVQCSVSPRGMWPQNYGRIAAKHGVFFLNYNFFPIQNVVFEINFFKKNSLKRNTNFLFLVNFHLKRSG